MAKTRRRKINKSPVGLGRHIALRTVEPGFRVKVAGHRTAAGSKMVPSKDAKPVFVGRTYTGENLGKVYPYASVKRGGAPA
jgi:hypothetical protein